MAGRIAEILPAGVAAAEAVGDAPHGSLLPEEAADLGNVVEKRRREFTAARSCARRALAQLGVPPAPILRGPRREPLWPQGFVGSITHCHGYCAAVAAPRSRLAAIGIDAEIHDELPAGVLRKIAVDEERAWLRSLSATGVHWDRLLFSAKESVYKAWYPLAGRWLGFQDALVTVDPSSGTFSARLLVPGPSIAERVVRGFDGRFLVSDGRVLTAVTVEA